MIFLSTCANLCDYGYSATFSYEFVLKGRRRHRHWWWRWLPKIQNNLKSNRSYIVLNANQRLALSISGHDNVTLCNQLSNHRCIVNDLIVTSIHMNETQLKWGKIMYEAKMPKCSYKQTTTEKKTTRRINVLLERPNSNKFLTYGYIIRWP